MAITPISKLVRDAEPADIDADGDMDVLVSSETDGRLVWYENNGSGTFNDNHILIETSKATRYFTTSDFNGDGLIDFTIGQHFSGDPNSRVFINSGSGNFTETQLTSSGSFGDVQSQYATDVDDDGDKDILELSEDFRARWFENLGNGSFGLATEITSPFGNAFRTFYDVTGDGILDAFLFHNGSWYVMLNDGNGNFSGTDTLFEMSNNDAVRGTGDFNGDGDLDIVVNKQINSDNTLGWYENDGQLNFSIYHLIDEIGPPHSFNSYPVKVIELDGYPKDDIVYQRIGTVFLYHILPQVGAVKDTLVDRYLRNGILDQFITDFNGDSLMDLLACAGTSVVFGNGTTQLWNDFEELNTPGCGYEFDLIDLNKDGLKDIVTAPLTGVGSIMTMKYLGNKEYEKISNVIESDWLSWTTIHPRDFDHDGLVDIGYTSWYSGKLTWIRNNPNGFFGNPEVVFENTLTSNNCWSSAFDDFDGDGDLDAIQIPGDNDDLMFCRNQGSGFDFEPIAPSIYGSGTFYQKMITFDQEGDGDMDAAFLAAADVGGGIVVLINDGNGHFSLTHLTNNNLSGSQIDVYDFDEDGDMDILTNGSFSPSIVVIYEYDQGQYTRHTFNSPQDLITATVHASDVDNDGFTDILCTTNQFVDNNPETGVFWFKNLGGLNFSSPYTYDYHGIELSIIMDIETYDFDHDGDDDMFLGSTGYYKSGSITYFENLSWGSYRVQGHVFYDTDTSGTLNNDDLPFPYIDVQIDPTQSSFFTNAQGEYNALTGIGTYTLTPGFDTTLWQLSTPNSSFTVTVDSVTPTYSGLDFGVIPNGIQPSGNLNYINPLGGCMSNNSTWVTLQNTGNTFLSGVLQITIDTLLEFVYSVPLPDSIVDNNYYFHVDSLSFYEQYSQQITVEMPDPSWIGVLMEGEVSFYDQSGLIISQTATATVTCAYDPNDKTEHTGIGAEGYVADGQWLEYTVRFQNTGNAPATDVIIRDQLDRNLDWSSLTPVAWSHDIEVSVEPDGDAVFKFLGIMLVDSGSSFVESQGFIRYRIKADSNLYPGTQLHNTANIFFDSNPPVITNSTVNTVECYQPSDQVITWNEPKLRSPFVHPVSQQWFRNDTLLPGETGIFHEPTLDGVYRVEAIYPTSCKLSSEAFLLQGLAVDEISTVEAVIYPNPSRDKVFFRLDRLPAESSELIITDVSGRLILRKRISSMQFDVSVGELGAGYFLAYINTAKRRYLLGKLVTVH